MRTITIFRVIMEIKEGDGEGNGPPPERGSDCSRRSRSKGTMKTVPGMSERAMEGVRLHKRGDRRLGTILYRSQRIR